MQIKVLYFQYATPGAQAPNLPSGAIDSRERTSAALLEPSFFDAIVPERVLPVIFRRAAHCYFREF